MEYFCGACAWKRFLEAIIQYNKIVIALSHMPVVLYRLQMWNENAQPASASVEDVLISVGLHARSGWSQYREHSAQWWCSVL